jgi:hypothetical protein
MKPFGPMRICQNLQFKYIFFKLNQTFRIMKNDRPEWAKYVRTVWNEKEQKWYFVLADIVRALTSTTDPFHYIKKWRKSNPVVSTRWNHLVFPQEIRTNGGRQKINCVDAENALILLKNMNSHRVKPFKIWLDSQEVFELKKEIITEVRPDTFRLFLNLLTSRRSWVYRIKKYLPENLSRSPEMQMTGFELLLSLLEENDLYYHKA